MENENLDSRLSTLESQNLDSRLFEVESKLFGFVPGANFAGEDLTASTLSDEDLRGANFAACGEGKRMRRVVGEIEPTLHCERRVLRVLETGQPGSDQPIDLPLAG